MNALFPRRRMITAAVAAGLVTCATLAGVFFNASYAGRSLADSGPSDWGVICFGHVDVDGGVVALNPAQPGRVVKVEVRENQAVQAGDVLLRLDDGPATLRLEEADAACRVVQAQLAQMRRFPEQQRSKVEQQKAAVEAARFRLSAARHQLERKKELQKIGQLNAQEAAAAADLVRELEAVERAEQDRLAELDLVDPLQAVQRVEAESAVAQARAALARRAVEDCSLRAAEDGKVLRIQVNVGDLVGALPGPPAVLFSPDRPRIIRAEVTQEFAGQLQVGQGCVIADDYSAADRTWRGKVVFISDWFTQRRSILSEPAQRNDVRTLECIVQLDPGQPAVRIGQRMRLTIGP